MSETVCSYFLYGHMWLHCFDMLSCPDLWLKIASSSIWGGSSTSLTWNTCLYYPPNSAYIAGTIWETTLANDWFERISRRFGPIRGVLQWITSYPLKKAPDCCHLLEPFCSQYVETWESYKCVMGLRLLKDWVLSLNLCVTPKPLCGTSDQANSSQQM